MCEQSYSPIHVGSEQGEVMPFYVLEYLGSITDIVSAMMVGAGVLVIFQASRQMTRQQRLHNTAELLSPYYDRLIAPIDALRIVSADEFAQGAAVVGLEKVAAYDAVLRYLNSLEYVSVLINTGTIDERVAAKLIRGTVVAAFRTSIEYVMKVRAATNNPRLYQELETLAHRWGGQRDI